MLHSKRLALFQLQPFRWFALQCLLVNIGSGLLYINLTWIAVKLYSNANSVALLMLSFWLPVVIFGPLSGVLVDRFPRKPIIALSNVMRALLLFVFYGLMHAGMRMNLWQMCLLMFISGICTSFVMPAIMTFVREIVAKKQLLHANTTIDIAYELGNVLGMGAAGFIIAYTSMSFALLLNGLCFLLSAICMIIAKAPKCDEKNLMQRHWFLGLVDDYSAGMGYLWHNKKLCLLYMVQLFVMAVFMTSPILLAPYAKTILHANVGQFGGLESSISVGVVLGGLLAPWLAEKIGTYRVTFILLLIMLSAYLWFCLNRDLFVADGLNVLIGLGLAVWPLMLTLAQSQTKLAFQGRVQATFNSVSGFFIILVYLSVTFYGDVLPISQLYVLQIVLVLCSMLFFVLYKIKKPAKTDL